MQSSLSYGLAMANQQELLRRAEMTRQAGALPDRQSAVTRFLRSIPSPGFSRRRSAKLARTAPVTTAPGR